MKSERKVEVTGRFAATAPNGEEALVVERTELMRVQELSGRWSEWLPGTRSFNWGGIRLNLREDGDWETAEYEPRRLTRRR
jgi:hypothetical protein